MKKTKSPGNFRVVGYKIKVVVINNVQKKAIGAN